VGGRLEHLDAKSGEQGSTATARSFVQVVAAWFRPPVERGQSFAEYAVILALVVLVGSVGFTGLGSALGTMATNTIAAIIAFL
jgi:Flp pilus assembly pilin Flp